MSSHQISGAIADQEGQGPNQVHRWRAFAVLAVSFFMTVADLAIVNVVLPTIGRELHMAESDLQWVVTGYALTFGGFLLLGGRAADLLGRRRILMAGLSLFTAASLGCGLATAEGILIAMRFLQGLGAAIVLPAALSIVMNMFPEGAERNKALGAWGAIGASGAAVGVMAGGLLTRYLGWEYIFYLNVPIGAAALLFAPRVVPESRIEAARRRYDPFGAVAVTGGLSLLVYAISTAPQVGWGTARTVTLLAVSAALLAAFVVIETRVEAPLMPLRTFENKTLAGANAVGVLLGGSFFAYIFIGTLYMQQVLGYSALKAGLAWLEMALISVAFAGLSQALVTRGLAKLVMAAGMAMIGGGILWSTQVPVHGHFWASLAGPFFIVGVGTAFAFIPVSIAALAGVAEHEAGVASGLINTSEQLGGALGIAIASTIAATHARTLLQQGAAPAAALTSGFQWAFWACGIIGLAAVPVTYLLVRRNELATAVARTSQKPRYFRHGGARRLVDDGLAGGEGGELAAAMGPPSVVMGLIRAVVALVGPDEEPGGQRAQDAQILAAVRSWTVPGSGPDTQRMSPSAPRGNNYGPSAEYRSRPIDWPTDSCRSGHGSLPSRFSTSRVPPISSRAQAWWPAATLDD